MRISLTQIDKLDNLPSREGINPAKSSGDYWSSRGARKQRWYHSPAYRKIRGILHSAVNQHINNVVPKLRSLIIPYERIDNVISCWLDTQISKTQVIDSYGRISDFPTRSYRSSKSWNYYYIDMSGIIRKRILKCTRIKEALTPQQHYSIITQARKRDKEGELQKKERTDLIMKFVNKPELLTEFLKLKKEFDQAFKDATEREISKCYGRGYIQCMKRSYIDRYNKVKILYERVIAGDHSLLFERVKEQKRKDMLSKISSMFYRVNAQRREERRKAILSKDLGLEPFEPTGKFTVIIRERKINEAA